MCDYCFSKNGHHVQCPRFGSGLHASFTADLVERAIVVTCPDNERGGATIPRVEGWEDEAVDNNPTLHAVEGPYISGCYVLRWREDPRPDNELLAASLHIVKAAA